MAATLVLHGKDARAVAQGHPWVYREAIAEKPSRLRGGEVVDLSGPGRPFLGRGVYDSGSPIAVRVWTRDENVGLESDVVEARVREAARLREMLRIPERATAWRLVNSEGDGMPGVVVDRYGEWLTVTLQTEALATWVGDIVAALRAAVPARGIYLCGEERSDLVSGEACPEEFEVAEPAGRFLVSIAKGGKSGLFADMREARATLWPLMRGKSVLNLFAHTGTFSACAASAAAREVVSVDLSGRYLAVARRNVELNAPGYARHQTIAADVFETLARLAADDRRFDVVVCDPPTFSASRRSGAFSVRDHYRPLVRAALRVLAPGGLACFATNFRGVTREQFLRLLHDGAEMEAVDLRVLLVLGQPADFPFPPVLPETAYLQFAMCSRGG